MDISYKKLGADDCFKYRELRLKSLKLFPDAFGATYEEEMKNSQLRFESFIARQLNEKFMIGAFNGIKLIGICGFINEEQPKSMHRGIIVQMYVDQAYSRKKIGQSLLHFTLVEAFRIPQLKMITLGVVAGNHAAIKIYSDAGFVQFGILKDYYFNGTDFLDHYFMALYKESYSSIISS